MNANGLPSDDDTPNNSMDARLTSLLVKVSVRSPASSQPLDASCLKTQSDGSLKTKRTRSAFLAKLREVKRCAEDDDASNNSMDVRAKQLLFKNLRGYFYVARIRFCPTSSQALDASWQKHKATADLKIKRRRSA